MELALFTVGAFVLIAFPPVVLLTCVIVYELVKEND